MEKTYTVCGTAKNADGTLKVRVANDMVSRIKTLVKYNCTEINLIELPEPLTKLHALEFIKTLPDFNGDDQQDEIRRRLYDVKETTKRREMSSVLATGSTRS